MTPCIRVQPSEQATLSRLSRPGLRSRTSEAAPESLIQIAKQLPGTPSAGRRHGIAPEHVHDRWRRATAGALNMTITNIPIIANHNLGCPRRMGRRSENVLHLVSAGQRMQVRSGCREHRRSCRLARGRDPCVPGRFERRPRGVAQRLPALTAPGERPCGVDCVPGPRVGRAHALEDLQDTLRAFSGIPGDLTKILPAQGDLAGFARHRYHPRRPYRAPSISYPSAGEQPPPKHLPRAPRRQRGCRQRGCRCAG
jgi:hypothetical protein